MSVFARSLYVLMIAGRLQKESKDGLIKKKRFVDNSKNLVDQQKKGWLTTAVVVDSYQKI